MSPFTRFDGVSVYKSLGVGQNRLSFGIFGGNPLLDIDASSLTGLDFSFEKLIGTQITLDGNGWRVRAQASRFYSRLQTSTPYPNSDRFGIEQVYSFGYRYDKHNIVSWGEYFLARTPNGTDAGSGRYADQAYGFYWLGGYRFGKWMPRYTFTRAKQHYNVNANGAVSTHTVGVNYQAEDRVVVKAEYERLKIARSQDGSYFMTQAATSTATSTGAVYVGLDFIF